MYRSPNKTSILNVHGYRTLDRWRHTSRLIGLYSAGDP